MNGLVVRGLQVSYGDVRVLSDLDLDIRRGEVVGVAGLNGVGKTTLLRALSGVVPRRATLLSVDGVALPSSPRQVARAGVLHVPEGRRVFANLSVIDNLRYGAAAAGRSLAPALRTRVFQTFPRLAELRERRAGLLSGGEQQMLAVARGLVAEPAVLMVDELSLGLSPKASTDIGRALVDTARSDERALLLVDQNTTLLNEPCDRIYVVSGGRATVLADSSDRNALDAAYFAV